MTYQEALSYIHALERFGSHPGLDRVEMLFRKFPEALEQQFIHIAGTNGKGSVSAMLSSILEEAGYKVGLFISPYIVDFRERIQINNEMVSEQELVDAVSEIKPYVDELADDDIIITEFEFLTVVAFYLFKQKNCDVVVCEVGMGGLLDSTNVIRQPLCSVITRIALDHTDVLGSSVKEIAFQKCGIIKRGSPVAVSSQSLSAMRVIREIAEALGDPLYFGENLTVHDVRCDLDGVRFRYLGKEMQTSLIGEHQVENICCALAAIEALRERSRLEISAEAIRGGLTKVSHPARFERLSRQPTVILDGAHNPNGLEAFAKTVKALTPNGNRTLIIGMLSDKDVKGVEKLKGLFDHVIATNISNPRAMAAGYLGERLKEFFDDVEVVAHPKEAYQKALSYGGDVFICGSLYLASEIRPVILGQQ